MEETKLLKYLDPPRVLQAIDGFCNLIFYKLFELRIESVLKQDYKTGNTPRKDSKKEQLIT